MFATIGALVVAGGALLSSVVFEQFGRSKRPLLSPSRFVAAVDRTRAKIEGGAPGQREILESALRQMPDSPIEKIVIGDPPQGFSGKSGSWLNFTIKASDKEADVRGTWDSFVVAGVLNDVGPGSEVGGVSGTTVSTEYEDGRVEDDGSTVIDPPPGDAPVAAVTGADLDQVVRSDLLRIGINARSIRYLKPHGFAAVLELVTDDPAAFVRGAGEPLSELVDDLASSERPIVDGLFASVFDENGRLVSVGGYSTRTAQGVGWSDPAVVGDR